MFVLRLFQKPKDCQGEAPKSLKVQGDQGFTMAEVMVALMLSIVIGTTLVGSLLSTQQFASTTRITSAARIVLQRQADVVQSTLLPQARCLKFSLSRGLQGQLRNGLYSLKVQTP